MARAIGRTFDYLKRVFESPSSFTAKQNKVLDPVLLTQPAMHGAYRTIESSAGPTGWRVLGATGANGDPRIELWTSGSSGQIAEDHVRYVQCVSAWHNDATARRLEIFIEDLNGSGTVTIASNIAAAQNEKLHLPFGFPIQGRDSGEEFNTGFRLGVLVNTIAAGSALNINGYFVDVWRGELPPF
jgi:hypothetical protein